MSKHTPGPWTTGVLIGIAGQDEAGISIGFVNSNDAARRAECKANARLIAAAPELLASLIELVGCIDETRGENAWKALSRSQRVIAKATEAQP